MPIEELIDMLHDHDYSELDTVELLSEFLEARGLDNDVDTDEDPIGSLAQRVHENDLVDAFEEVVLEEVQA